MRTWNNTKQQLPNGKFTVQDWWDDILDNVKEGDKVINGTDNYSFVHALKGTTLKTKIATLAYIMQRKTKLQITHIRQNAICFLINVFTTLFPNGSR